MKTNYLIALNPVLPNRFYKSLQNIFFLKCSPSVHLPFHLTLYYLGPLSSKNKKEVIIWLQQIIKSNKIKNIKGNMIGISCFKKRDISFPHVYYLSIQSIVINRLYIQCREKLQDIYVDMYPFIKPHISLFFPKKKLSTNEINTIKQEFKWMKEIKFNAISFMSVKNEDMSIEKIFYLD